MSYQFVCLPKISLCSHMLVCTLTYGMTTGTILKFIGTMNIQQTITTLLLEIHVEIMPAKLSTLVAASVP